MTAARRAEFAAGRSAAKRALSAAGHPAAVLSTDDGVPVFPDGYTGSIAHKHGRAIAVVTASASVVGIGIDIEFDEASAEADLRDEILAPSESALPEALSTSEPSLGSPTTLVLSLKEAIYKAVFPTQRTRFAFDDLELGVDGSDRSFCAVRFPGSDGLRVRGRYALAGPWMICIAAAFAGEPAATV